MIKIELTEEEAEVISDYVLRKCYRLEEANLKDSKCYPNLYSVYNKIQRQLKK